MWFKELIGIRVILSPRKCRLIPDKLHLNQTKDIESYWTKNLGFFIAITDFIFWMNLCMLRCINVQYQLIIIFCFRAVALWKRVNGKLVRSVVIYNSNIQPGVCIPTPKYPYGKWKANDYSYYSLNTVIIPGQNEHGGVNIKINEFLLTIVSWLFDLFQQFQKMIHVTLTSIYYRYWWERNFSFV